MLRWLTCFWRGHTWVYHPGADDPEDDPYGYHMLGFTSCERCGKVRRPQRRRHS